MRLQKLQDGRDAFKQKMLQMEEDDYWTKKFVAKHGKQPIKTLKRIQQSKKIKTLRGKENDRDHAMGSRPKSSFVVTVQPETYYETKDPLDVDMSSRQNLIPSKERVKSAKSDERDSRNQNMTQF